MTTSIVDNGNATAITIGSDESVAIGGSVSISHASGDSLTLTKTTTEPSLRLEGDSNKDFVITVSGELLTITQNDGGTDILTLDHDTGAVKKPLQPAFSAVPASQQDNIAPGSGDITVVFGTEIFDQGGNFVSSTFTAPVTGRYQLQCALRLEAVDIDAAFYQAKIITGNRPYIFTLDPRAFDQDPAYHTVSLSVLADMDASDTAIVTINQSGGAAQTDIDTESYFSGYLVA